MRTAAAAAVHRSPGNSLSQTASSGAARGAKSMDCLRCLYLGLALAVLASSATCAPGARAPRESATATAMPADEEAAATAATTEATVEATEATMGATEATLEATTESATEATEATTEAELLGLAPTEWLLPDGSRSGSLVYVDSHGDLRRVKYEAGPAAGPEGFHMEDSPVEDDQAEAAEAQVEDQAEAQASGMAPMLLPAPKAVRRDPTPRPSDAFWRPKERSDLKKPVPRYWG